MAEFDDILARAADGGRIEAEDALRLYTDAPFHALAEAANAARERVIGDDIVTYIIDRNINYTNVCTTACKFCAFYRAPKHDEGWTHDNAEVLRRCGEAVDLGATQVMLQGGHHPEFGVEYYEELFSAVKEQYPDLVIHSIGPSEIDHMSRVSGVEVDEAIKRIKAAGLDSIAGAGAEMLPERPRKAIAPLKEPGGRWLEIMEAAHVQGLESTATMMMGTGETNAERIEHLRMIRDVQDRTGGFRSFIPWTYQPENNHLKGRTQATALEYLRLLAVARLFFHNVTHLQSSWLTVGKAAGQLSMHLGVDDLGSIMLEENVISSAGARNQSKLGELIDLIRSGDRVPAQRNTVYERMSVHWTPEDDPSDDRVRSHFSTIVADLQQKA
ncbi:cyclic dehypoxanthinyl futalosine synthase [Salininema proteolyticum]|uniref:Cyclic dehypoxanthine futalosine synthase n=1 Tax=Salininema proteolyticum TaxID=1607685 RepID=A0ABV8U2J9_9ACTN